MKKKILICTDLDRTLIPNGAEPESPCAPELFRHLVQQPWVTLAYVSGRDAGLVQEAIEQYGLPRPDYVISDVGTSLYQVPESEDKRAGGEWQRNTSWEATISAAWNGKSNQDIRALLQDLSDLSDLSALRLQEESRQGLYKLSYYIDFDCPAATGQDELEKKIRQRLCRAGIRANLIWSHDDIENIGLLDILPASASKLHAIEALMEQLGFAGDDTVFCGDSGNDMEVLTSCIPAVLVANAAPEVKRLAAEGAQRNGYAEALYIAVGGFMDMNGNYSAGMLEGIARYHPEVRDWLAGARHAVPLPAPTII
ncbi:MAG: HAD-IIB family hydrolase [Candidatus Electrothrix sp. AUS1_2]|nr:HAD-IIB family hydrolase [Candidatus Electrothrix sp. AUS1_2]